MGNNTTFVNRVLLGDCLDVLKGLPDACVDCIVTDPPYGLGTKEPTGEEIVAYLQGGALDTHGDFMSKPWEIPTVEVWRECLRVLKPGGHLLSFGGSRTFDLISLGLRAAGFENRDTIADFSGGVLAWCHGQGFPKSLNISKAIDKISGAEREVLGPYRTPEGGQVLSTYNNWQDEHLREGTQERRVPMVTAPATPEAAQWEGWGTALKPSWEPILVFRKPLSGTVAQNVLEHGTGGLNIDATRVKHSSPEDLAHHVDMVEQLKAKGGSMANSWKNSSDLSGASDVKTEGRWPPNVVLVHLPGCKRVGTTEGPAPVINRFDDGMKPFGHGAGHPYTSTGGGTEQIPVWECVEGCPVRMLDEQSGAVRSSGGGGNRTGIKGGSGMGYHGADLDGDASTQYGDSGGASRFFPQFEGQEPPLAPFFYTGKATKSEVTLDDQIINDHPTKKPVELMRWLVKLVCPKGGIVLDPYCGSGSTLHAASVEGMRYVGIEKDPHYHEIAVARMDIVEGREQERRSQMEAFDIAMSFDDD